LIKGIAEILALSKEFESPTTPEQK